MIMLHVYRNGVCGRCGKTDDGVRPQACSGRSRADASAMARRAAQTLIEEIGADGPVSVEEVAQKAVQEFRALRLQLVEARAALEESEHSMHLRIRAGYDRTVADSWRKKVAEVETERDEARAEIERLRRDLARCREAQRATAEGWRHEVAEVASIIGAPAHTAELAACVRAEVERLMRERDEAKEHARLAKMIAARVQAERDEARAEVEKLREAAASSMNLCSWECSDETYCGRCAPLVRALDQEQPEPEEDE